jgi:recombining binding protein (suppressor of hairless)
MDTTYHLHPTESTSDGIDTPDHAAYEMFPGSSSTSFSSNRYRTNASSSSSLAPNYAIPSDGLYSHSSYGDSVPTFSASNGNPYEMINSLPSSYGSGKVSPLTPSDPSGGLHHIPPFPSQNGKEFSQGFSDVTDRRFPTISPAGFAPEMMDEYSIGGMNGNGSFPPPPLQHFPDRLGRFPPENRYHTPAHTPTIPSHVPAGSGTDMLRGIPPHATHSFGEGGVRGYEDMPHFMGATPHSDLSLRMPTVDETMARMKLQGHSIMGASNDLQTFIR